MRRLPNEFAVLRKQSSRGPFWQFFSTVRDANCTTCMNSNREIRSSHEVTIQFLATDDHAIYTDKVRRPNGEALHSTYWILPLTLHVSDSEIPVVDFHFRAWLPTPQRRVSLDADLKQAILALQSSCECRASGVEYQRPANDMEVTISYRPPTPPRRRTSESSASTISDEDVRSVITVVPGTRPPGGEGYIMPFPPLPDSPPPSQTLQPIYLPERVGFLIIDSAYKSEESCPITAIPYSELPSLTVTSCFHVFETDAVKTWLQDSNCCPVCRCTVTNMVTKEVKN